jgi:hypothetical protein
MVLPKVNAVGATIDGTRGDDVMSPTKLHSQRSALCLPVSMSAFQPNGLSTGLLLGESTSLRKSNTNRILSASRQSRFASENS